MSLSSSSTKGYTMKNIIELLKNQFSNKLSDSTYQSIEDDLIKAQSNVEIKKSNDMLQRITVEIVAEPNTPDAHDEWYSIETIEKGFLSADKAWREGRLPMNLFHAHDDVNGEHIELVKHYLVPFDCEINGEQVKEGSWCVECKWHNKTLFEKRTTPLEDGSTEIAGLSLRGWGTVHEDDNT